MITNPILIIVHMLLIFAGDKQDDYRLTSPNSQIELVLSEFKGALSLSQIYKGDTIIKKSPIGLVVNSICLTGGVSIISHEETTFKEDWQAINGKNGSVINHYNEYTFQISKLGKEIVEFDLVFRCYNDGFAYRYLIKGLSGDSTIISSELTSLNFKTDFTFWAYNGERPNIGPVRRSASESAVIRNPMVIVLSDSLYMAILEAEIINYAPFSLNTKGPENSIRFNLPFIREKGRVQTSWRSFILGNRPSDLLESNLLMNLNAPCKIEEASWIKPGKSLWDWRIWGYKTDDGFEYGLNTTSHKRLIDFASENNIQYLLIDADWYGPEFSADSDPTKAKDGIEIEECMAYANDKGVGIILYLNDVGAMKFGLEKVLKQFSDWGAVGVKYGFMRGGEEERVRRTREVVMLCAKYRLMVDFHDNPIAPSGDMRTYPNLITKEFGHAQADAKSSYYPETAVSAPFINMVAGPLDLTNGWFDLNNAHNRVKVFEEIPGTVVAEVAKLIVIYSGWMVLPDSPEEYLKKEGLFDCVRQMPAQFDSFKVLDGEIGEYIVVARGDGDNWFVGSLTNREARTIDISFDFLPEGINYIATLYEDAENTHFLTNKESYRIRGLSVDRSSTAQVRLAPGGGHAIWIRPANKLKTP